MGDGKTALFIMKKITAIFFVACLAMLCTACHKEGVYNPSKKISKIYHTNSDGVKSIDEVWTWNKNNTLEKIDYYSGNSIYRTNNYTYDNKRLVKINDYTHNEYVEFKYDGYKLKEANCYDDNILYCIYTFTYKDGKISKIESKWLDDDYYKSSGEKDNLMALDFIMPRELNEAVAKYNKRKAKEGKGGVEEVTTISLTWEKGNVTKALITEYDGEYEEYTWEAKYDNKKNPFLGFSDVDVSIVSNRSKNNIVESIERWNNGSDYYKVTYDYSYEGQYPVSYRKSFVEAWSGGSYSGYSGMTEYEYTK